MTGFGFRDAEEDLLPIGLERRTVSAAMVGKVDGTPSPE
jgi:hypothetical protein